MHENNPPSEGILVSDDGTYSVLMREAEPFWVWEILVAGDVVQQGASISENAARLDSQKVARVLAQTGGRVLGNRQVEP
jgi:soluble methane monooxygenase-binding protein MmoD